MKNSIAPIVLSLCIYGALSSGGCTSSSSLSDQKKTAIAAVLMSYFTDQAVMSEGRAAVNEILQEPTKASSVSVAFIDHGRLAWTETFGLADKESMTAPTAETMYCIGSTSKVLAAIAVMKLVDLKLVSLDVSLKSYITSFEMASPQSEYEKITVRMLLNHSSGFPGTDERNAATASPVPNFSAQVMETLKSQRLKHAPGYLSVYCNDGFTMVEQLVLAVAHKSYAQFLQDEVFTPLGMNHTRYPLDFFPADSFAKRYSDEGELPQLFLNTHASGGLYSTPADMAKIAIMLMGEGRLGTVQILTKDSVDAMGVDQTLAMFSPDKSDGSKYGLGWDTVRQPGLGAVGITGWQKGGDVPQYGSVLTIAPDEKLAVVVMGASGKFSSSKAAVIAERMLLRALFTKMRIKAMPAPLTFSSLPEKTPAVGFLDSVSGYYANNNTFLRVQKQPDNSLTVSKYDTAINDWKDLQTGLKLRDDDRFYCNENPSQSFFFASAEGRRYLITRLPMGYGHYQDDMIYGQQIPAFGGLPAAWAGRIGMKWLMANEHPESDKWTSPVMQLYTVDNMLFATWDGLEIVNPSSDTAAGMMLLIPGLKGRDLNDIIIEDRSGQDWVRFGSYLYSPIATVPALSNGTVSIGVEGFSEWRSINAAGSTNVTIVPAAAGGRWKVYDSNLQQTESVAGSKTVTLPGGSHYLVFHSNAAVTIAP